MTLALLAIAVGLILLVWSAERFVDGAAALARHFRMPALLIGMLIVGFGTSAPEMAVGALAAVEGNPGIALGNAYGSNIANIGLILGVTALMVPIAVQSQVVRKELPVLIVVTALAAWQVADGELTRLDALVLLGVFAALLGWSIWQGMGQRTDALSGETEKLLAAHAMPLSWAIGWLVLGLVVLIGSSRLLVWGAVTIAQGLGVSDLVIGLTVVAVGTSLPELASSLIAVRKGEQDIALGNVIGSNLFNTLAVVGIAASIRPMPVGPEVLSRDMLVMSVLTLALFLMSYGFRGPGRINRAEGALLLTCFLGYTGYLIHGVLSPD